MLEPDYIAHALARSSLDRRALLDDVKRCEEGPGRLSLSEYIEHGLYDWQAYSAADRLSFLSDRLHWPIVAKTCDFRWNAVTEDKWLMEATLRNAGVATPPILAVLDGGIRLYPGCLRIKTAEDFHAFLKSNGGRPFFGKKLQGMASEGIFCCTASDQDSVTLFGEGTIAALALFDRIKSSQYVFQHVVRNHSVLSDIADNLCTLRIAIFVYDDVLRPAFAFLKVPTGNNLTDLFRPVGNLAAGLDIATGCITSVRERLQIGTRNAAESPEAGRLLLGLQLPFWAETLAVAARVAQVFAPVRYQSLDIAFTNEGPVVIEVNTGGGFRAAQMAYGRGLLRPDVLHFFQSAGVNLAELNPMRLE